MFTRHLDTDTKDDGRPDKMPEQRSDKEWWKPDFRVSTLGIVLAVVLVLYCLGAFDTLLFKNGIHANFHTCYQNTVTGYTLCCGPLSNGHGSDVCKSGIMQ
jgi:hypothetical protein